MARLSLRFVLQRRFSAFSSTKIARIAFRSILVVFTIWLLISATVGIMIGPVNIPPVRVWQIAFAQLLGCMNGDIDPAQVNIVWFIRFPRVIAAAIVGAALGMIGAVMQAIVRNPLADPYLLGLSSGASVGAVAALSLGVLTILGPNAISLTAFLGALTSFVVVLAIAQQRGVISPLRLILAGLAVSYCLSGLTSLITLTAKDRDLARSVLSWMLGSLGGVEWADLWLPTLVLMIGGSMLIANARSLNAIAMGDETASTLGVDTARFRRYMLVIVSLITGTMVAISGAIGFVGLMIPHAVRRMVGADHRRVLVTSALAGASFMIWVDLVARTTFSPVELPVGVITSLLGGPFFLWLMFYRLREGESRQ